ncbi:MAG: hypothetical protein GKR93_14605 [Gammaproteobacteria bacterium]|nr:hypothetical protein [Gammaproteobacteria bacterium]
MTKLHRLIILLATLLPILLVNVSADDAGMAERKKMIALGLQYGSAEALYEALVKKAGGGQPLAWNNMPDWEGVYGRTKGGLRFDPDGPNVGELPTAKFTPEYHARLLQTMEDRKNGIEYDPLSQCIPPGYPRWLDLPFLREFIVTPKQTTMFAEAFNSVRRIYTDGRGHLHEDYHFPTENGDSIGVWDGHRLITHTNMLMAHMYERSQGFYSEEVEGVEIWEKVDERTMIAHVWIYDPPALAEPWYTRQSYTRLTNDDKAIRITHWACKGNDNNDVIETEIGGSSHRDFTFDD